MDKRIITMLTGKKEVEYPKKKLKDRRLGAHSG
jgi:hypothetical protein